MVVVVVVVALDVVGRYNKYDSSGDSVEKKDAGLLLYKSLSTFLGLPFGDLGRRFCVPKCSLEVS